MLASPGRCLEGATGFPARAASVVSRRASRRALAPVRLQLPSAVWAAGPPRAVWASRPRCDGARPVRLFVRVPRCNVALFVAMPRFFVSTGELPPRALPTRIARARHLNIALRGPRKVAMIFRARVRFELCSASSLHFRRAVFCAPTTPRPPSRQSIFLGVGSSSGSSRRAVSLDGDPVDDPYPVQLDGMVVTREAHPGRNDIGLRVACPVHDNCKCYRSTKLWVTEFGVQAPVLFLRTWMARASVMPRDRHNEWRPGKADLRLFLRADDAG